ncbi:MAG: hypothetical protein ACLT3H_10505 [Roseburia sp.]
MLGKLFKYEFKNTYKIMLTIYAVLGAVTLFGSLLLASAASPVSLAMNNAILSLATAAFIIMYTLAVFALFIITYVYVCTNFYKTMFSNQGYLTHTLPVSTISIFHVKLLTSLVWLIGSVALLLLSVFLLIFGATRGELLTDLFSMNLAELHREFTTVMGMNLPQFVNILMIFMIFGCLSSLLMIFASICIGQLFNQNKIVFSIVAWLVLNFVQQTISSIVPRLMNLPFSTWSMHYDRGLNYTSTFADILCAPQLIASYILSLLFMGGFYATCLVILRKHINLA